MPELTINEKIHTIQESIKKAQQNSPQPSQPITLLAVSKTKHPTLIRQAYAAGIKHFGENYAQEAELKIKSLCDLPITWHFIGSIQSNKCNFIANHIHWVHCIDRLKIAQRLNTLCQTNQRQLNILIQINISNESSKAGIALNELHPFIQQLKTLSNLTLRGLSVIPNPKLNEEEKQKQFQITFKHFTQMKKNNSHINTLSMGMSNDYQLAIQQGSTLVRIGTALFGARSNTR